jgi:DNA-binding winged helix-turn-helix (wHTH) protein
MQDQKTLTFSSGIAGLAFRLEIRGGPNQRRGYMLFLGDKDVTGLSARALEVLEYLAERSGQLCSREEILDEISPHSDLNLIDRYVSSLRQALCDDQGDDPKFIETISRGGYRFLPEVEKDGELGSITAYSVWDRERFSHLVKELRRKSEDREDMRISVTALGQGIEVLNFEELLRKRLRIKVLFMNPANEVLVDARHELRDDRSKERCIRELDEQLEDLRKLVPRYPHVPPEERKKANYVSGRGELELAVSDIMPCGYVVHAKRWALVGLFLAHKSYSYGPMIEIRSESPAWEELRLDWEARWNHATTHKPKIVRRI